MWLSAVCTVWVALWQQVVISWQLWKPPQQYKLVCSKVHVRLCSLCVSCSLCIYHATLVINQGWLGLCSESGIDSLQAVASGIASLYVNVTVTAFAMQKRRLRRALWYVSLSLSGHRGDGRVDLWKWLFVGKSVNALGAYINLIWNETWILKLLLKIMPS